MVFNWNCIYCLSMVGFILCFQISGYDKQKNSDNNITKQYIGWFFYVRVFTNCVFRFFCFEVIIWFFMIIKLWFFISRIVIYTLFIQKSSYTKNLARCLVEHLKKLAWQGRIRHEVNKICDAWSQELCHVVITIATLSWSTRIMHEV